MIIQINEILIFKLFGSDIKKIRDSQIEQEKIKNIREKENLVSLSYEYERYDSKIYFIILF